MANAYEIPGRRVTYDANADLSLKLFHAVKLNSSSKLVACDGAGTTNEVQTLTRTATGATFTVIFDGETSGTIDATSAVTAAVIQTALDAMSNINPGDVVVAGATGGPFTITFGGQYTGANVPLMTTGGSPTGGSVTIATTTAGGAAGGANGDRMVGVLQNKPEVAGAASTVMLDGISKAVAGAAIAVNDRLKTNGAGRFIPVTSASDVVAGVAETLASTNGELFTIRFGISA